MMLLDLQLAAISPYVTAAFGLAGTVIGGSIAGYFNLVTAKQARQEARSAWILNSRREVYDRFLTTAQELLIACLESGSARDGREGRAAEPSTATVEEAYSTFFGVYGAVQWVAGRPVVDAARGYAYRLQELKRGLESKSTLGGENFSSVAMTIRSARHDTIDAMRNELGLDDSARPPSDYNPFAGTDLEGQYRARTPSGR